MNDSKRGMNTVKCGMTAMQIPFHARDYQTSIIDFALERRRVMLMAGMGTGKTSSTLAVALARILAGLSRRVLVIAPQRVADLTWPDEIGKWENFQNLSVSRIIGDQYTRHKALSACADVYTINYENLVWLLESLGDTWPFDTVIADESTKLKSYRTRQGGKRAQALAQVAAKTRYWINLTGTPTPNGLKDLWGQMWFIDGGKRLGKSYNAFITRWFYQPVGNQYKILPHKHAFDEIMELISDVCISIEAKDYLDLPPLIDNVVTIKLPEKARLYYDEMEREFFTELETGHEVEAFNEGAKLNKCLQIASGAVYTGTDRRLYQTLHDEKLYALESIIGEACGMPVLVSYNFRHELDRLKKFFKHGQEFDKNPATLKKWNAGKIPIMFCHPASAGHGLNMQDGGNILAFFGSDWNLETHLQIIERIGPTRQVQSGHNRPVYLHHIIAENTVDEMVLEVKKGKATVQDAVINKLKQRKAAN